MFLIGITPKLFSQPMLYYNGQIYTSDTNNLYISYFIVENGIIIETGDTISDERIAGFQKSENLMGKTIIPGFIDSHIHFIDGSLGLNQVSLVDVKDSVSLEERILETLGNSSDGVYVARELSSYALLGVSNPLKYLDYISPEFPVIIFLKSGHAAIANSAGMNKLGFSEKTKIADGLLGLDETGKLNGWLMEAAAMEALKNIGEKYKFKTLEKAILTGQELALSYGITTIGDNTFSPYNMKIYQSMQRDGNLKLRIWTRSYGRIPQTTNLMEPMGLKKLGFIGPQNDYSRVHYHLSKLFTDMSLSVPIEIAGNIEPGGEVYLSKNEIENYLLLSPETTFAFHVQGKQGLQNIIDALIDLGARNNNRRHVIDHAGYCTEKQLEQLHNLGASVTILASQTFDYPSLIKEYSNNNVSLIEDDLLNVRQKFNILHGALTSDFPYGMDTSFIQYPSIDGLSPLSNMAINITGMFPDGSEINGFSNKTISVSEAIQSYTTNGAYVLGEENFLGKISKGYAADFIILNQNIPFTNPMELYNMEVLQTYISGEKVYDRIAPLESLQEGEAISPYDYTISPLFGYDPTVGFIFGGAGFVFPLKIPGNYGDLQIMASSNGNFNIQGVFKRFEIFNNVDFKLPVTANNFVQYYYGELDTTNSSNYKVLFSDRILIRPEFSFSLNDAFRSSLFADFRYINETNLEDNKGNQLIERLMPNETSLGLGMGLSYDTRDNPISTKLGFYGAAQYINVSSLGQTNSINSNLFIADFRYFHYIYNSKFVLATRFSAGALFGNPGYMFRYTLGGAERLRGYYTNRFRGDLFYSAQAEFRFPLYKKFSGVCFIDEGDISEKSLDKTLVTFGGGVRFSINSNVVLRLDYGIAKDQNGVFFTFGEAF